LREAVFERDFAVLFLTLFYESALMPAIKEGTPVGAGVLCVHLHRRPGIDRGGGFYLQASGWSGGAIAVVRVERVGKKD
jgi:hypothetical protein